MRQLSLARSSVLMAGVIALSFLAIAPAVFANHHDRDASPYGAESLWSLGPQNTTDPGGDFNLLYNIETPKHPINGFTSDRVAAFRISFDKSIDIDSDAAEKCPDSVFEEYTGTDWTEEEPNNVEKDPESGRITDINYYPCNDNRDHGSHNHPDEMNDSTVGTVQIKSILAPFQGRTMSEDWAGGKVINGELSGADRAQGRVAKLHLFLKADRLEGIFNLKPVHVIAYATRDVSGNLAIEADPLPETAIVRIGGIDWKIPIDDVGILEMDAGGTANGASGYISLGSTPGDYEVKSQLANKEHPAAAGTAGCETYTGPYDGKNAYLGGLIPPYAPQGGYNGTGRTTLAGNNAWEYLNLNVTGEISDNEFKCQEQIGPHTQTIEVEGNEAPTCNNVEDTVPYQGTTVIDLDCSDPDDGPNPLTCSIAQQPPPGEATVTISNCKATFTHVGSNPGDVTFTYKAYDGQDYSDPPATATVTVQPPPPPNKRPIIWVSGFGLYNSDYDWDDVQDGLNVDFCAVIEEPDGEDVDTTAYLGSTSVESFATKSRIYDGSWGEDGKLYVDCFKIETGPISISDMTVGLSVKAVDTSSMESTISPFLQILLDSNAPKTGYPDNRPISCGEASQPYVGQPKISLAGFGRSTLSEDKGGGFRALAVVDDPQGRLDISKVEVYFYGRAIGLSLYDDGRHDDFGPGDSVYGARMSFTPSELLGLAGLYQLEIVATDEDGHTSPMWPCITLWNGPAESGKAAASAKQATVVKRGLPDILRQAGKVAPRADTEASKKLSDLIKASTAKKEVQPKLDLPQIAKATVAKVAKQAVKQAKKKAKKKRKAKRKHKKRR